MRFNLFGSSTQRKLEGPKPPIHDDTGERQRSRNGKQDHGSVLRKTTNYAGAEGLSAINSFSSSSNRSDSTKANLQSITHVTQSDQRQPLSENLHKQPEPSSLAYERTKDKGDQRQRHYQEPMTEESSYDLYVRKGTRDHSAIVSPNKSPEYLIKQPRPGLHKEGNLWSWIPHLRQSVDDKNMVANVRKVFVLAEQYVNNYYVNRPLQELPEDFPAEIKRMSFPHLFPNTPITDVLQQVRRQDTIIKHCLVSIIVSMISLDCDNSYPSLLPLEFTQLPKALQQSTASERKIPYLQAALSAHRVLSHYIRPNVTDDQYYLRQRDRAIDTVVTSIDTTFAHWRNESRIPEQRIFTLISLLREAADLGILLFTQASTFLFDWKMQSVQSNDMEIPIWPRMLKVYDEEARELDPAQHMSRMKTEFASFISDVKPSKEHDKPLAKAVTETAPATQPTAITEYRSNSTDAPILQDPHERDVNGCCAETKPYDQQAQNVMSSSHGVHEPNVPFYNSVGHRHQEADLKFPHYTNDPDSTPLQSQDGIAMHELGTRMATGLHETLPILISEHGEDRDMPNGSQSASANPATTCFEMPGDATRLPRELAELEDAARSVRSKFSNAAEKLAVSPERHHQDRHQGSGSPAKHKIGEPVELADSIQVLETEPRHFPGPSQQYATNLTHHTTHQKPTSERLPTLPPNSFPSAQKRKMVGSDRGRSTSPPLARPPSLKDRRSSDITDGPEGQEDFQLRHHHSHSRGHSRSCDPQYAHDQRRSMDTYPGSLPPDVHASYQHGLVLNQNRQSREAYKYSFANKSLRGLRPSSSDPANSTASVRRRQKSMKPKWPSTQWKGYFQSS